MHQYVSFVNFYLARQIPHRAGQHVRFRRIA